MTTAYTPTNAITYELVTHVALYTHCCEASDLGLRAGQWPEVIACDPKFGNGCPLVRADAEWRTDSDGDRELLAMNYRQVAGVMRLRVFND